MRLTKKKKKKMEQYKLSREQRIVYSLLYIIYLHVPYTKHEATQTLRRIQYHRKKIKIKLQSIAIDAVPWGIDLLGIVGVYSSAVRNTRARLYWYFSRQRMNIIV